MKNYNQYCLTDLYYVKRNGKLYEAVCLYCGYKKIFKTKEEIMQDKSIVASNIIMEEQLNKEHIISYNYDNIKELIDNIILKDPTLSNDSVVDKLRLTLYENDLTILLMKKNKSHDIISQSYYQARIDKINVKIQSIITNQSNKPKQKIKDKK